MFLILRGLDSIIREALLKETKGRGGNFFSFNLIGVLEAPIRPIFEMRSFFNGFALGSFLFMCVGALICFIHAGLFLSS